MKKAKTKPPTTHTPGPWRVSKPGDLESKDKGWCVWGGGRMMLSFHGPQVPREQKEADAHLVAAAPDLLAACVSALSLIAPRVDDSDAMGWGVATEEMLREAIAKAKGATP